MATHRLVSRNVPSPLLKDEALHRRAIDLHRAHQGKIEISLRAPLETRDDLSLAYSPGVAAACRAIEADPKELRNLSIAGRAIAVVTDGSAVLGLGRIGPAAAMPVMEGKAALFRRFAGLDAWPICLHAESSDEIVDAVRAIAPGFAGINLEDIAAPECFEVEDRLQDLGIPVMHDDQHGTAIVLLAALMGAAKLAGKELGDLRVVIAGAGAAGTAIAKLLRCVSFSSEVCQPVQEVILCDSKGAIHRDRKGLIKEKRDLLAFTNLRHREGTVHEVLEGADVFIGVSQGGLLDADDVRRMAPHPILFPMANPTPEIDPDVALAAGAIVVGTGRSDYPNQVNNVLAFPGVFRGAIDAGATSITQEMKLAAAKALAEFVGEPTPSRVLPGPFEEGVAEAVAAAVRDAWERHPG
ncbi:NAD-dependent malic enzyme [Planctomycetes bacterium Poly30]|uniref:NAD-dependent malic enzyme n=2 Tax=Saltatorellus ferox TaxID=2528018 RepID=A0A518EU53_9BACT|nr:NAD-dependent malic enzyme [Planctomycetes bacterium Poly30]